MPVAGELTCGSCRSVALGFVHKSNRTSAAATKQQWQSQLGLDRKHTTT